MHNSLCRLAPRDFEGSPPLRQHGICAVPRYPTVSDEGSPPLRQNGICAVPPYRTVFGPAEAGLKTFGPAEAGLKTLEFGPAEAGLKTLWNLVQLRLG